MNVDYIVVHCSATPPTMSIGAADIDRWHRAQGWLRIGYHAVIRRSGVVEQGRPIDTVGAHVSGFNDRSLGVCLVGGVDSENKPEMNFTAKQMQSLERVIKSWLELHPDAEVVGHRDLNREKACPSFNVKAWWAGVRA